jgi:hypothetical protein
VTSFPYRIVDADNHYYEPDDCFTRHLDPTYADRAYHIVRDDGGPGRPYVGSEPAYYMASTPVDLIGRPGVHAPDKDSRYVPLPEEDLVRPGEIPWFVDR